VHVVFVLVQTDDDDDTGHRFWRGFSCLELVIWHHTKYNRRADEEEEEEGEGGGPAQRSLSVQSHRGAVQYSTPYKATAYDSEDRETGSQGLSVTSGIRKNRRRNEARFMSAHQL
jgi:hypothetical protein